MKQTIALIVGLTVALAGAIWGAISIWFDGADVTFSLHVWIAIVLCALGTLVIGGGLMALVFYSSRHGYDDEAGH